MQASADTADTASEVSGNTLVRLAGRDVPYKHIVAVAFVLGLFMDILDTTIVNVALPTLLVDFHTDVNTIEWVVTGYLLSLALWIPCSGWLGDRFGSKRIFVFALAVFTAASALCGLAWNIESLVAFRVLQGVGGGMLTPVGTAMLFRAYPPAERPRASSLLTMITVLAPAVGPLIGGILVEQASWRWIFYVNLPIGVVGIWFSVRYLRNHAEPATGAFDVPGFVLSGAGLALLLFGLAEGPVRGWDSALVIGCLVGAVAAIVALVFVERWVSFPLLDLELLAERSFRTPNIVSFLSFGALLGLFFLLPQFLQGPAGYSPIESGLATAPQALGVILSARITGLYLYPRIGPRRLAMTGMLWTGLLTAAFYWIDVDTSPWWIRLLMVCRGLGMGMTFIPLQAAAFAQIPPHKSGRASALYSAQRQAGAAVGVAVLATILVTRREALVGGLIGDAALPHLVDAYHQAMLGAVALSLVGFVAAAFIRDADAAAT
ncbi:MAG TPA: MDR family MFS transporter, partial [Acidimicrobiales bacterium]|nr:MDR family MFS transporter [Acidimicrobiales bacterium]